MPAPSLENRLNFKTYLRQFKDKFTSRVQDIELSYLENMFSEQSENISSSDQVKVIIFDNKETIDLSTEIANNDLLYFPALPGDELYIQFNSKRHKLNFVGEDGGVVYNNTTYVLNDSFYIDGKIFTVEALGSVLLSSVDGPTYTITPNSTNIGEGDTVTFSIVTTDVLDGTNLYYEIVGDVSAEDFSDNVLTGQISVTSNSASFAKSLTNDFTPVGGEGTESFYINLREDSISGPVVGIASTVYVLNTSFSSYSLAESTTSINEGDSVEFTLTTSGIPDGTTLYYTTSGITSASDFSDSSLSGSFVVNSGIATVTRTLSEDLSRIGTEGTETFQIQIRTNNTSGNIVATSSTITVSDTSFSSYTLTQSTVSVSEGDPVVFTLNTIGVPDGTTLYYTSTNTTDVSPTSGSFNVNAGISTFTLNVLEDTSVDPGETFYVFVRTSSTSGDIVGISSEITIVNTTVVNVSTSTTSVSEGDNFTITLDTEGIPDGSTLYYTSTSPNDISPSSGSVVVSGGSTSFILTAVEDLLVESEETFQIQIRSNSISGDVVGISSSISLTNTTSFLVSESISTINEGENVSFTVTTTGVPDGTSLYYTTTSSLDDINPISGSFTINSGISTFIINANNDLIVEPNESFQVQIREGSTSGGIVTTSNSITLVDVPYSLAISSDATVVEGNFITFTVTTTGITDATTLYYTTAGISTTDIPIQSGSFTIFNNRGTFSLLPAKDLYVDDDETFTVQIRAGSISGTVIATSSVVNIDDSPYTITVTPSSTNIIESTLGSTSTITFNIVTSNVDDGITLNARITPTDGNLTSSDFSPNSLERSFTLSNFAASFSWDLVRDALTEGSEKFVLDILDLDDNVIASSPEIIISDGSFIGSRSANKTFGPIRVNRDNGNTAQVSDWFLICDLDALPDGSKIALFIDNSGSMTTATVQASYDEFIGKINEKNMDIIVVTNPNEDWITPFNTILD